VKNTHYLNTGTGLDFTKFVLRDSLMTVLTGPVVDQAALHGLLKRVRDLGMPLLSVNFVSPDQVRPKEDKL
jgi:hypothetical protein